MSEFSTSKMVKDLTKAAHSEENKGYFEQAETLYKAVVTLEEMSHFPVKQIEQAKKDATRCEDKAFDQMIEKALESYPSLYDLVHPSQVNDNGMVRHQESELLKQTQIYGQESLKRLPLLLDTSESIAPVYGRDLFMITPHNHADARETKPSGDINSAAELERKSQKPIPTTTDTWEYSGSKGCP